jgi:hypothetical protein
MPFKKGQSGNPAGKKKGTKDKKWAHIATFWKLFLNEWPNLKAEERASYAFQGFKMHFDRAMANLPLTQDDSKENAVAAHKLIQGLEHDAAISEPAPVGD